MFGSKICYLQSLPTYFVCFLGFWNPNIILKINKKASNTAINLFLVFCLQHATCFDTKEPPLGCIYTLGWKLYRVVNKRMFYNKIVLFLPWMSRCVRVYIKVVMIHLQLNCLIILKNWKGCHSGALLIILSR